MVEFRFIILIILGIFTVAVVAIYVWTHMIWADVSFLNSEKLKLIRNYACSLALCTRGCGSVIVNDLCLENNTVTNQCSSWCSDYCTRPPPPEKWGGLNRDMTKWNNPGTICGSLYPIEVSIEGRVPIKGLIASSVSQNGENYAYSSEMEYIVQQLYLKENFPLLQYAYEITKPDGTKVTVNELSKVILGSIGTGFGCGGRGLTYTCNFNPGLIFTESELEKNVQCPVNIIQRTHIGALIVADEQAQEYWGCYGSSVAGFDRCLFYGTLNLWTDHYNYDPVRSTYCADVRINASRITPGDFFIDVTPVANNVKVNDDANYQVRITNNLGSTTDFSFTYNVRPGSPPGGVTCSFNPTSPLTIDSGSFGETIMTCRPTIAGKYNIEIWAEPRIAVSGKMFPVSLKAFDFELVIIPNELSVEQGALARYIVRIINNMDEDGNFSLSNAITVVSGGPTLTCTLPSNLLVARGATDDTFMDCSGDVGEYKITVTADVEGITKDDDAELEVTVCGGNMGLSFSQSELSSGQGFDAIVTGLTGCSGRTVKLAVFYPELVTNQECGINSGEWQADGTCKKTLTAYTPGTYNMYAYIDKNGDGDYSDSGENNIASPAVLKIVAPTLDPVNNYNPWPNSLRCEFGFGGSCSSITAAPDICDQCGDCIGNALGPYEGEKRTTCTFGICVTVCGIDPPPKNCGDNTDGRGGYGDPQSNVDRRDLYASASNLCCIANSDSYSPGPADATCLSPDTNTHHDRTNDIWYWPWSGGDIPVENARNLLVQDSRNVTFNYKECDWNSDGSPDNRWCTGDLPSPPTLPPSALSSTTCVDYPDSTNNNYVCKLPCDNCYYTSWEYIRISQQSRPVYGIKLVMGRDGFYVYLHNTNGEWFMAGNECFNTCIIRPSSGQSWNNIDAILIGFTAHPNFYNYGWVDYVGLLTKGSDIPYCTDGDTSDYYRVVDNGMKCYWGTDCPSQGSGWTTKGSSWGVGGIGECNCNNAGATCGNGYCNLPLLPAARTINPNAWSACYYNVACENGGWRNPGAGQPNSAVEICDSSQTCTSSGCGGSASTTSIFTTISTTSTSTSTSTTTTLKCCCDNSGCLVDIDNCCWSASCPGSYPYTCGISKCGASGNC